VRPLHREVVDQLRLIEFHPFNRQHPRHPPIGAPQPVSNREILSVEPAFALDVNGVFGGDVQEMGRLEIGRLVVVAIQL
jgi:hypothetical protein